MIKRVRGLCSGERIPDQNSAREKWRLSAGFESWFEACATSMCTCPDLLTCSPDCYHSEVESRSLMHCYPTSDHVGLEFSAFPRSGGLVAPAEFASMIGGIFPIALCGRSSL